MFSLWKWLCDLGMMTCLVWCLLFLCVDLLGGLFCDFGCSWKLGGLLFIVVSCVWLVCLFWIMFAFDFCVLFWFMLNFLVDLFAIWFGIVTCLWIVVWVWLLIMVAWLFVLVALWLRFVCCFGIVFVTLLIVLFEFIYC